MLILRGNHGWRENEAGKKQYYKKGALHEPAAIEYARRRGYEGIVLDVSGDPPGHHLKRSRSPQTLKALVALRKDTSIRALYGFSGGGYNVYWILHALSEKERDRIDLVVVIGAEDTKPDAYDKSDYPGAHWELVYKTNPDTTDAVVPKGVDDGHMFGPEWLLAETPFPAGEPPI